MSGEGNGQRATNTIEVTVEKAASREFADC